MLASAIPTKIQVPFATSGDKVDIPIPSQIGINDGRASWSTGFVPLNATPLSAGGVAPFESDFNGIFNQITAVQQWQCAGGIFKYDATFSAAIGGYPKGARLLNSSNTFIWVSLVDNNTTNPETGGIGWISYGVQHTGALGISGSTILTANAHVGKFLVLSTAPGVVTVPAANSVPAGATIALTTQLAGFSLGVPSGTNIAIGGTPYTSLSLTNNDTAWLVSDGTANWFVEGGTASLPFYGGFAFQRGPNGYQKFPGGTILQYGSVVSDSTGKATIVFPMAFPSNAAEIGATMIGITAGTVTVSSPTPSGFVLNFFNSSGAAAGAGVQASWRSTGY